MIILILMLIPIPIPILILILVFENAPVLLNSICIFDHIPAILEPAWSGCSICTEPGILMQIQSTLGFNQDLSDNGMCTPGLQGGNIGVTPFISILRKLLTNMEMNMCSNCGQVSVLCIGLCGSHTVSYTVIYQSACLLPAVQPWQVCMLSSCTFASA